MKKCLLITAVSATGLLLSACGGSGSDNTLGGGDSQSSPPGDVSRVVLNAGAQTRYLNLITGQTVDQDGEWHLAVNRTNVITNSGASGDGNVGAALGNGQPAFYDSNGDPDVNVFANPEPYNDVSKLSETFNESGWESDKATYATGAGSEWSSYDRADATVREKADTGYLIRSAEGDSYARMRIVDFTFPTRTLKISDFTLEFDVHSAGGVFSSAAPVVFTPAPGYDGKNACFDFDSGLNVDCSDASWDVQIGYEEGTYDWFLKTNSGSSGPGNGAALGPMSWSELAQYSNGESSNGTSLARSYSQDTTGGVFSENSWFAYNLGQQHKIWPNFRVYLINTDTEKAGSPVYATQITDYYGDDNGASGRPVVRWKKIKLASKEAN